MLMQTLTATQLRSQIYSTLNNIIETGNPVWIEKNGHKIKISLEDIEPIDKFKNLKTHKTIVGDPDELVNVKVGEWSEEPNL